MMHRRKNPVPLVVDGLPAHKKALVKEYVASTAGKLTLHFLPSYAPDLNSDELLWSHAKRTGIARSPLRSCSAVLSSNCKISRMTAHW